jgi:hypothetical protein
MSETVTLADIERLCWRLSGWTVDQRSVDDLMTAITRCVGPETDQAPRAGLGGGEGEAEPVHERPAEPSAPVDAPEAETAPQTDTQRLHITGEITVVCRHVCERGAVVPRDGETHRDCNGCGKRRPITDFHLKRRGRTTRRRVCRDCEAQRKRDQRAAAKAA